MHPLAKRAWLLVALGLLAVPVTAAGVAYACTALATINLSSSSVVAGATVTVSGKGFAPHDASDIRTAPAEVHLDSATGPMLAKASPSSNNTGGTFSVAVTISPDVPAGHHVLVVTQNGIDGRPAYGTPARTVLEVQPKPAPPPAAAQSATVPDAAPVLPVAPLVAPPVNTPAAPAASTTAEQATARARVRARARARAISSCRSKYSTKRAKTSAGRKRMARKRASCIRAASSRAAGA